MKKKVLIVLINFLVFIVLIFLLDIKVSLDEFYKYYYFVINGNEHNKGANKIDDMPKYKYSLKIPSLKKYIEKEWEMAYRIYNGIKQKNGNNDESAIWVFGCSFAAGALLSYSQNFEYKLNKITGRTVYNFGLCGFGISGMLFEIKNFILTNKFGNLEKPKIVIYIFLNDHYRRIYADRFGLEHQPYQIRIEDVPWTLQKKKLFMSLIDSPFGEQLLRFYFVKKITSDYINKNYLIESMRQENFNVIKLYFETSKKLLEQKYPNIKFVIIKYPSIFYNCDYFGDLSDDISNWKKLEDEGFIIIDLKTIIKEDLTDNKYLFSDGHPNEEAWNIITDKVVKKLELQ